MELVFLCLGWGWLFARSSKRFRRFLDIYQPDEFATQFAILRKHLRNLLFQDANSIYSGLLVWILFIITALHHLKNLVRNSVEQEVALNRYQAVLFFLKPTVTIATGCVTIACHIFNNWGRLDKWAAAFGTFRLLWLAANLAFVEVVLPSSPLTTAIIILIIIIFIIICPQPCICGGGPVHWYQDGRGLQFDLLVTGSSCSPA